MRTAIKTLAGCWLVAVLSVANLAAAAERDTRLVQAAADQDRQTVRELLKQGVDVNAARADGVTALLWAAHWNDLDMIDALLKAGAKVNAADDYGVTALTRACENTSEAAVTRLLAAGANPNAAQKSGLTPLMVAARTGNINVVKALLAHGANVNAATAAADATPLMWAVAQGYSGIVRVLVEGGANPRVSTAKGFTPLMFAARNGDIEMAKLLIAAGVDVNERGSDGTHVLPYAIVNGQDKFALFLIEQGANPNGTINDIPALHTAAGTVSPWLSTWARRHGVGGSLTFGAPIASLAPERRLALVKALVAKGADPNGRISTSAMFMGYIGYPKKGAFEPFSTGTGDLVGATPLWVAAYTANGNVPRVDPRIVETTVSEATVDILKVLLAAGANPHLTTVDGTTPLMVAAGLGRPTFSPGLQRGNRSETAEQAVKTLLDAGADINAINEADFTALHGAAFRGLNEVIQILVDRGADLNARDYKGRTPYRIAEGSKQSFQFQAYPATAEFIKSLGANTRLGVAGTVQERARDLAAAAAAASAGSSGQQQPQ
ncbi:MAG TPA: ankyrin repeat domain-containing protein [Vicinamibacterales bacterium]|nr:ankyrin repeat domain-containing protein [Vicinamibacterales bacterium]